ncbi:MAG: Ig-like domain-containing protein, partial [Bacteroidales bacterium]|nr:Ig-like domain-containing protein [Bacteroidales bacterium]
SQGRIGRIWHKIITISGQQVKVTGITVTGSGNASSIITDKGTLQMQASILPADASNKEVTWSISAGSNNGNISSKGLLSALKNGALTVKATAKDGSGVIGTKNINITGQIVKVTSISVQGMNNSTSINQAGGTLQLEVIVLPADAANKAVSWETVTGENIGAVNNSGLVTAKKNGIVKILATAKDGSNVKGEIDITISGQNTSVSAITDRAIHFYPNPAHHHIYFDRKGINRYSVKIFTITGLKVLDKEVTEDILEINLQGGCYVIVIAHDDEFIKEKLLIY